MLWLVCLSTGMQNETLTRKRQKKKKKVNQNPLTWLTDLKIYINLCVKEGPQVVKVVSVALNHSDHAFRQHNTLLKQLSRRASSVCSKFSHMCQRPQADQEKLCPLSPPPGHLTTAALSVQRHSFLALHGLFSSTWATLPLSEGLSPQKNDSWLRKSFAFEFFPGHLVLVEDRGITQRPMSKYGSHTNCS